MARRKSQNRSKTFSITSKNIPKTSGVYKIKKGKRSIYAGQTNNLKRRVGEHLNGKWQKIDRYLNRTNLRNIRLGCTPTRNPGRKERQYMKKIKKREGKSSLQYNFTRGNTVSRKNLRRRRRR